MLYRNVCRMTDLFEKKEISKIQILYTHYKNTLTFVPTLETVLPVSKPSEEKKSGMHADMILNQIRKQCYKT